MLAEGWERTALVDNPRKQASCPWSQRLHGVCPPAKGQANLTTPAIARAVRHPPWPEDAKERYEPTSPEK